MTPKNTLRFGVIGAGRIGKLHAQNLTHRLPHVEVATIADVDLKAAQDLADQLHIPVAVADYRLILSDPTIAAIAICSSTDTHASIIIEAAQAGKHIFCEKPIALGLDKIDAALDTRPAQAGPVASLIYCSTTVR